MLIMGVVIGGEGVGQKLLWDSKDLESLQFSFVHSVNSTVMNLQLFCHSTLKLWYSIFCIAGIGNKLRLQLEDMLLVLVLGVTGKRTNNLMQGNLFRLCKQNSDL